MSLQGLREILKSANKIINIIGINPLFPIIEDSAQIFSDLLIINKNLRINILYESDNENFNQSLCARNILDDSRMSYTYLSVHRRRVVGSKTDKGLIAEIKEKLENIKNYDKILSRISLKQINLRLPINIIQVDNKIYFTFVTDSMPNIDDYIELSNNHKNYNRIKKFINYYIDKNLGGIYLSNPTDELIQMYDLEGYPRGIFPRASFYTTRYMRYSIWGFVFNRKGQILLHQRSEHTKDNRLLWDKSIGGHVDVRDRSTAITAKRELIEELFLPEAEFTKYTRAELGDIIHFGDWLPNKRPERSFTKAFASVGEKDWIMFRATDSKGDPLTITRISKRRILNKEGNYNIKRTVFRSDVYLFIAPKGYMDTHEEMKKLVELAEVTGAAFDHRLISMSELQQWIEEVERDGNVEEVFTDDLLEINTNLEYKNMLVSFSEFINYVFKSKHMS